jgi:hypothetical protein
MSHALHTLSEESIEAVLTSGVLSSEIAHRRALGRWNSKVANDLASKHIHGMLARVGDCVPHDPQSLERMFMDLIQAIEGPAISQINLCTLPSNIVGEPINVVPTSEEDLPRHHG